MTSVQQEGCYPIRAVSRMTGVNAATLRAWERRYGLVTPSRSESGQRLYSPADVEKIRRIVTLVDSGVSPSRVADAMTAGAGVETAGDWDGMIDQLLQSVSRFDETGLDSVYRNAMANHPLTDVTQFLTIPALERMGTRWESGDGLVAEEHFFRNYVRNALGSRLYHRERRTGGAPLVCACVPGEQHDIGLLLFCLNAEAAGYRAINLGADTPLEDLAAVAARVNAAAVVLAANYGNDVGDWVSRLEKLVSESKVPVLVGGRRAAASAEQINDVGATCLGADIPGAITQLQRRIAL